MITNLDVFIFVTIVIYLSGQLRHRVNKHSRPKSSSYFSTRPATWQVPPDRPTPPFRPAPSRPAPSRPAPSRPAPPREAEWSSKAKEAGQRGEEKVRRKLHHLGLETLHDIILVDDRGPTQIDHVVKTPTGFVVLETKNYTGFIFGSWKNPSWTRRVEHDGEKHDTSFQNPVHQNFRHQEAVKYALGESRIEVTSHVVFVGDAKIGDSIASCILSFDKLGDVLWSQEKPLANSGNLEAAWERLRLAAQRGELRRNEHSAMFSRPERPDKHPPF